jgi:ParB/RepB/Spo0J family partition protein
MTKVVERKEAQVQRRGNLRNLNIAYIQRSLELRQGDNAYMGEKFKELVQSIKTEGIVSPLIVRDDIKTGTFKLIDGRRRLYAAKHLGIKKVPVIVYDANEDKAELLSIIANTNQQKLTPIELGIAYQRLLDNEVYASKRELATALGVSESTVGTRINNLKLDSRIIEDMMTGEGINDQKVLKAIRLIEKVNEEYVSEKQWTTYSYIVEQKLNREDALQYIKTQKEGVETVRTVRLSDSKIDLSLDMSGWDKEKVERVNVLLAEIETIRQEVESVA